MYYHLSSSITKQTKWPVHPAKTQISLGIRPVWSESSLCALWVASPSGLRRQVSLGICPANAQADVSLLGALVILLVLSCSSSFFSCNTKLMSRLIRVFAGCTLFCLFLSCFGSFFQLQHQNQLQNQQQMQNQQQQQQWSGQGVDNNIYNHLISQNNRGDVPDALVEE